MFLSALTSSLPQALEDAIQCLADMQFRWIDVPPQAGQPACRAILEARGLRVACVRLEHELPAGIDLADADPSARRRAVDCFAERLRNTRELGAGLAYLTPPTAQDDDTRQRWVSALLELAERAQDEGVQIGVEHFPGRLLPDVAGTLALLKELDHPQLALLLDVGHCLISREDPAAAVHAAGNRLAYVHLDDNDGEADRHWPLLAGKLTEDVLRRTLAALQAIGYRQGLCLELFAGLDDPEGNLRHGQSLVRRLLAELPR